MRISGKFAFLVLGLLVFSIASSALTHSVNGASTQNNITDAATSEMNMTTNDVIQKQANHDINVSELQSTDSNPFKEIDSTPKTNLSNELKSQDKDSIDKDESKSSSSSPEASDSSCSNDGNGGCKDDQKSVKKNNDNSKNKDETVNKEQKHKTRLDVKSIKDKIKSDIKNRFKLPIDIPFP